MRWLHSSLMEVQTMRDHIPHKIVLAYRPHSQKWVRIVTNERNRRTSMRSSRSSSSGSQRNRQSRWGHKRWICGKRASSRRTIIICPYGYQPRKGLMLSCSRSTRNILSFFSLRLWTKSSSIRKMNVVLRLTVSLSKRRSKSSRLHCPRRKQLFLTLSRTRLTTRHSSSVFISSPSALWAWSNPFAKIASETKSPQGTPTWLTASTFQSRSSEESSTRGNIRPRKRPLHHYPGTAQISISGQGASEKHWGLRPGDSSSKDIITELCTKYPCDINNDLIC